MRVGVAGAGAGHPVTTVHVYLSMAWKSFTLRWILYLPCMHAFMHAHDTSMYDVTRSVVASAYKYP